MTFISNQQEKRCFRACEQDKIDAGQCSCINRMELMKQKEFILSAAIWVNDNQKHEQQPENIEIGFVICGRRHHNCYQTITDLKGDVNEYFKTLNMSDDDYREHQGFITSTNRYVNRREGFKIAKENNQIQFGLSATDNGEDSILISENLY
jgi:hypothetical protein